MERAKAPQSLLPLDADVGVQSGTFHLVMKEVGGGVAGEHDVRGDPPHRIDRAQTAAIVAVAPAGGPALGGPLLQGDGRQQQRKQNHQYRQLRQKVPPAGDARGQRRGVEGQEPALYSVLHHALVRQGAAQQSAQQPLVQSVTDGGVIEARRRQVQAPAEDPVHGGESRRLDGKKCTAQQYRYGSAVGPVTAVGEEHGGKENPGGYGERALQPEFSAGGAEPGKVDRPEYGGAQHQEGGEDNRSIQFWYGIICLFHSNSIPAFCEKNKGGCSGKMKQKIKNHRVASGKRI